MRPDPARGAARAAPAPAGNGNILERILSPLQLYPGPDLVELQHLARASVSRRFFGHYAGYFRGMCREHLGAERPTAKRLLYAYRVALTGTHLLETGELEANLEPLARRYGFPRALELIEQKRQGEERGAIAPARDARHREAWPELEARLERALEASPLPEEPPNAAALSEWLRARRIAELAPP